MTLGTGIAIAAIWMLPVASTFAPRVSGQGMAMSTLAAIIATWIVA